jgi:DNA-binding GntR family transcriptional regulator
MSIKKSIIKRGSSVKVSQTDQAYERLREGIISLDLTPGRMYSEVELAEFVGLGRTPAREAIQRLTREELVLPKKNKGILITNIDPIKQLQLLDVRRALEQLLAQRACEHATPEEKRLMLDYAQGIEQAARNGDRAAFMAANRNIQDLKARASHNDTLRNTMDLFFGLSRRFWVRYHSQHPNSLKTAGDLHGSILRAIAVSNVELAKANSHHLIDFLELFTRTSVEARYE